MAYVKWRIYLRGKIWPMRALEIVTSGRFCPSRVSIFSNFPCLSVNIFVCKFVYIVRTDRNPLLISILYIMMTACAAAYWATCG